MTWLRNIIATLNPANSPAFIAAQLKKPHGIFAKKVGVKMNSSNEQLYKLVLKNMYIAKGDTILEIGFGNGSHFNEILNRATGITLHGVELSKPMVQQAATLNEVYIKKQQLKIEQIHSAVLPFKPAIFDAAIAVNLVYFWQNPEEHLREIYRVLKPGGRLVIGIRPAEILSKLPFAQHGFYLRSETEWKKIIEKEKFSFISTGTNIEQDLLINNKKYAMQGQCMVFEK